MIQEIKYNNQLLAIIISNTYSESGIQFFTPDDFSQQIINGIFPVAVFRTDVDDTFGWIGADGEILSENRINAGRNRAVFRHENICHSLRSDVE